MRGLRGTIAKRPDWSALVLIATLAVVVRVAFATSAPPLIHADSEGYYVPARDLAAGLPLDLGLRRTPSYPLFVAAVVALFGEDLQVLVTVQHFLLGPATGMLTYLLGRLVATRVVALLAALLVAVSGPLLLYEHYVMSEALFGLLLVATLLAVAMAARGSSPPWAITAGLLFGAAILCRPVAQVLAPLLGGALLLGAGSTRRRILSVVLLGLAAAAVVLPWMASNHERHGTFAISSNGRFLLARVVRNDPGGFSFETRPGLVEDETRAAARRIVQQEAARRPPGSSTQRMREELGLSEAAASRIMADLAIEAIRKRPAYYLRGSVGFFWEVLAGRPIAVRREGLDWREVDWERRAQPVLNKPVPPLDAGRAQALLSLYDPARYGPLVPTLFLVGLLASTTGLAPRRLLLPSLAALALVAAPAALVGPVLRYRYPLDPLITLVGVQGAATAVSLFVVGLQRARSLLRARDAGQPV